MKFKILKKCTAIFCAAILMTAAVPTAAIHAENENLISNSAFDSETSGWATYYQTGVYAVLEQTVAGLL